MKRKQPKYSKGQTVYNSMLKGNYIISKKPDWNGFTYMYSFKDTDMSCGEMYLRLLPSTPVDEVKDKHTTLISQAPAMREALISCYRCLTMDSDMEEDFAPEIKEIVTILDKIGW